jgi:tRNA wybutosine-synthesizing protein 3
MNTKSFQQAKKDTLARPDKSFIGGIDSRIKKLCDKINTLENYYTTSSCSGRVVIMVEKKQKDRELFLFMSHDKISFEELKKELMKISKKSSFAKISSFENNVNSKTNFNLNNKIKLINNFKSVRNLSELRDSSYKFVASKISNNFNKNSIVKFKLDPCVLHVACESLEDADKLLKKAQLAGWKRNGIISLGRKIVVELNSTEKLEFPIVQNGKILVDDKFLKLIVEESNKKLEIGWEKIRKLGKTI